VAVVRTVHAGLGEMIGEAEAPLRLSSDHRGHGPAVAGLDAEPASQDEANRLLSSLGIWAMDANSDICADFLVEAREILDQLGEQMVVLEHNPEDADGLNAVFRGFHTIKGGAGFLDFAPMVKLCHAFEDRLNLARTGELPLDAVAFDGAQQAIDLLVDMIDAVASGEPLPEAPQALIDSLHPDAAAPAPSAPANPAELLEGDLDDLDFDALLDSLHGSGGVPGAPTPAPSPSPSPAPAPAPAP